MTTLTYIQGTTIIKSSLTKTVRSDANFFATDEVKGLDSWINLPDVNIDTTPFLKQLAKLIPPKMTQAHVQKLRKQFPQPLAADDPSTYEFDIKE